MHCDDDWTGPSPTIGSSFKALRIASAKLGMALIVSTGVVHGLIWLLEKLSYAIRNRPRWGGK